MNGHFSAGLPEAAYSSFSNARVSGWYRPEWSRTDCSPIADGYGYAKGKGSDRKAQGVKAESERLGTWKAKSGAMLEARRGHDKMHGIKNGAYDLRRPTKNPFPEKLSPSTQSCGKKFSHVPRNTLATGPIGRSSSPFGQPHPAPGRTRDKFATLPAQCTGQAS